MTKITDWHNCYDSSWKGVITDESFQHPAKFSHGLIRRIYQHLRDEYDLQTGDTVIDPFGGVALGALYAIKAGIHWKGCELEEKFVTLGRANINKWNSEYGPHFRPWGRARLLQGDSRNLANVIVNAHGMVSSPPYAESLTNDNRPGGGIDLSKVKDKRGAQGQYFQGNLPTSYGQTPGQLGAMKEGDPAAVISSPPYAGSVNQSEAANDTEARIERMKRAGIDVTNRANVGGGNGVARQAQTYGDSAGQLGAMKEGDVSAVVSSPPWAGNSGGRGEASRNGIDPALFDRHQGGMVGGIGGEGNLAGLQPGEVEAVITSPPYAGDSGKADRTGHQRAERRAEEKGFRQGLGCFKTSEAYGDSPGQLGNEQPETFWAAAKTIVEQCAAILPPGAPAVWVVKGFVRNGAIVDFPGQWQALCEACGFETVEIVRAWLVKDKGTQIGLDGEAVKKTISRKSFFRRLSEKNGAPAIDYEIVLFTRRLYPQPPATRGAEG